MVGARSLAMALNRLIDARHRRREPAHRARELPSGVLTRRGGRRLLRRVARRLPRRRLAARSARTLALADPRAAFVVYPYLKRFTWLCHLWLGAVDGLAPVGAWAAIKGELPWQAWALGGAVARLGRGLRPLLRALRRRRRPRAGPALVGDALRRARRVPRRAHPAPGDGRAARRGRRRPRRRRPLLARRRVRGRAALLRALARPARRPPAARRGVLHDERRHLGRVLRVRARRRPVIVGLLHPGEMGSAVGRRVADARPRGRLGLGRPERRDARARARGFRDAGTVAALAGEAELILSICPPHAALDVARAVRRLRRPLRRRERDLARARGRGAALHAALRRRRHRRRPAEAAGDDASVPVGRAGRRGRRALRRHARSTRASSPDASALKMAYAAWSKGTTALLLAIRDVARHYGVEDEWRLAAAGPRSTGFRRAEARPPQRAGAGRRDGRDRETFAAAGAARGFHHAAAEYYRS